MLIFTSPNCAHPSVRYLRPAFYHPDLNTAPKPLGDKGQKRPERGSRSFSRVFIDTKPLSLPTAVWELGELVQHVQVGRGGSPSGAHLTAGRSSGHWAEGGKEGGKARRREGKGEGGREGEKEGGKEAGPG